MRMCGQRELKLQNSWGEISIFYFFIFVERIEVTLVNKTIQVSSVQFYFLIFSHIFYCSSTVVSISPHHSSQVYNSITPSVYCIMCSPPKLKSPSITIHPLFTLFYLPRPPFSLSIAILLSVFVFCFAFFCFCTLEATKDFHLKRDYLRYFLVFFPIPAIYPSTMIKWERLKNKQIKLQMLEQLKVTPHLSMWRRNKAQVLIQDVPFNSYGFGGVT